MVRMGDKFRPRYHPTNESKAGRAGGFHHNPSWQKKGASQNAGAMHWPAHLGHQRRIALLAPSQRARQEAPEVEAPVHVAPHQARQGAQEDRVSPQVAAQVHGLARPKEDAGARHQGDHGARGLLAGVLGRGEKLSHVAQGEQHVAKPEHAISNHHVATSPLLHTSTTPQLLAGPGHDLSRVHTPLFCLPFEDYVVPNKVHKIPIFDVARSSYHVAAPAAKRRCVESERVLFDSSMIIEVMGLAMEDHLFPCFDIRALHRKDIRQIVVPAEHFLLLRIFRCALTTGRLINLQGMFYRHDFEDHETVWSRLQANVESRPLLITDNDKHGLNFYVPFCGGISGWTLAVRHLAQHGYPVRISAAAVRDSLRDPALGDPCYHEEFAGSTAPLQSTSESTQLHSGSTQIHSDPLRIHSNPLSFKLARFTSVFKHKLRIVLSMRSNHSS